MKCLAFVYAVFAAGCILPVSTGAPLPATTVGKGSVGFAISGEAPTLDLIADRDNQTAGTEDAVSYGAAPAAASTLTFSYGLTDDTDIEVAGEGALFFFIVPIPTGGSIGLRQHLDVGDLDLGFAARFGHVGSSAESTDSMGNKTRSGANANYGALQAILETKHGLVRPLFALNLMPAHIKRAPSDEPEFSFNGFASSITVGAQFTSRSALFTPYLTATNFYSDRFNNSGFFVSGGVLVAIRKDRNRPILPDVGVAPYDPVLPPQPPPQPYGQPYPPPQPAPMGPPPPQGPPPPPPTTSPM